MPSRPLFVTRKFPPSVGGMETLAAGVWRTLSAAVPHARLISYGGTNRRFLLWLPGAVWGVLRQTARRQVDLVLAGDALMNAVLRPVLLATGTTPATMVMGLDVTYGNPLYRAVALPVLRRTPMVLAISEATAQAARDAGVRPERVHVVRLGVPVPSVGAQDRQAARVALLARLSLPHDSIVLATLGRLVRRKGARWLVDEVLERLPSHVHYVLAGDGAEAAPITNAARIRGLQARVHLLGPVDDETREQLLRGADMFVQPNIRVPGDMEGFGLVVVEAAVRGTPVVASALEGLLDAVVDDETGLLLPPQDATAWTAALAGLVAASDDLPALGARLGAGARMRYGELDMGVQLADLLGLRPVE